MPKFLDTISKRYIVGQEYKSLTSLVNREVVGFRSHYCRSTCNGELGKCDGTQLLFKNGMHGCIYYESKLLRFEPIATPNGHHSNRRW